MIAAKAQRHTKARSSCIATGQSATVTYASPVALVVPLAYLGLQLLLVLAASRHLHRALVRIPILGTRFGDKRSDRRPACVFMPLFLNFIRHQ